MEKNGLSSEVTFFQFYSYFSGGSDGKVSVCNAGNLGSIPGSGRPPGGGNGNPFQYSCLENSMDCSLSRSSVHGVTKSRTQLSDLTHLFIFLNADPFFIKDV